MNEGQATGGEERDHELHEYCVAEGTSQLSVAGNGRDQEAVQRGTAVTRAERQPKAQHEHGGAKARPPPRTPTESPDDAGKGETDFHRAGPKGTSSRSLRCINPGRGHALSP